MQDSNSHHPAPIPPRKALKYNNFGRLKFRIIDLPMPPNQLDSIQKHMFSELRTAKPTCWKKVRTQISASAVQISANDTQGSKPKVSKSGHTHPPLAKGYPQRCGWTPVKYFKSLLALPMHPCLRAPGQLTRIQDGRGGMRGAIRHPTGSASYI